MASKQCVCSLGYTEVSGACVSLQDLGCQDSSGMVVDSHYWGVHPFCSAWGNSSRHGDSTGKAAAALVFMTTFSS